LSVYRKRRKTMDLYIKEREGKPIADCQSRSPMPSTSAEPSSWPWGQARPTGASEANRGKRGRWGQARLVGAGETGGGRKPPGQIPSQHIACKCISKLTRSRPPSASQCTRSRPPSASPPSIDHGLQVQLSVHSISASKFIS
jgi:hypothetical protein